MASSDPSDLSAETVLFLDFDGVLHPGMGRVVSGRVRHESGDDRWLFIYAPTLEKLLERFPALKIVLSTRWSAVLGVDVAKTFLPPGLSGRVIGGIHPGHLLSPGEVEALDEIPRGQQILNYVAKHSIQRWVALDDDFRMIMPPRRSVCCLGHIGFSDRMQFVELDQTLSELFGMAPSDGIFALEPPTIKRSASGVDLAHARRLIKRLIENGDQRDWETIETEVIQEICLKSGLAYETWPR